MARLGVGTLPVCAVVLILTATAASRVAAGRPMHLGPTANAEGAAFDVRLAEMLAALASAAYTRQHAQLRSWSCLRCTRMPAHQPFEVLDVQYDADWDLLMYYGCAPGLHAGIIVYCGTEPFHIDTWYRNAQDLLVPYPGVAGAGVHSGFYTMWTASIMRQATAAALRVLENRYPTAQLLLTGHSLGGAFATLAALDAISAPSPAPPLSPARPPVATTVITFGCPRVGNPPFAAHFDRLVNASWRLVNSLDTVPSVPLQSMGYLHVSTEVWEVGGVLKICSRGVGEDRACQAGICGDLAPCPNILDHGVYLEYPMGPEGLVGVEAGDWVGAETAAAGVS